MGYLSVLLADDEVLTRLDIREHIIKEGHIVCAEAGNGLDALELAKLTNPDIALLDIKMPGLDGIEVASQLKLLGIPTVLMTAYYQPNFINRAEKVGVYGYLNKPIRQQDILPSLHIAYGRWKEMQKLSKEIDLIKRKMEYQNKIERAKGIYAKEHGITEFEAHNAILKISMGHSKPLFHICDEIIARHKSPPPR